MKNMMMLYLQLAANLHRRTQRRFFAGGRPLYGLYETLLGDLERCDQAILQDVLQCYFSFYSLESHQELGEYLTTTDCLVDPGHP